MPKQRSAEQMRVYMHGYRTREPERCRTQGRASAKRRWAAHPEARYTAHRNRLLRRYGLTHGQYEAMLEAQDGLCAICGKPETRRTTDKVTGLPRISLLAVDHDHGTGAIRGLLCFDCNSGVGRFSDDPEILAAAMAYLTPRLVASL